MKILQPASSGRPAARLLGGGSPAGARPPPANEADADRAAARDAGLREEGVAAGDTGDVAQRGPVQAVAGDGALHDAMPAGKVAPDNVHARATGIRGRVRIAVYPGAHPRHAIEKVHDVERRAGERVVGHLSDGDRIAKRVAAIGGRGDHLEARVLRRIGVLGPEDLDGTIRGDGYLTGLTKALRGVVIRGADLHGLRPRAPLIV